jgi:hypothetical protein
MFVLRDWPLPKIPAKGWPSSEFKERGILPVYVKKRFDSRIFFMVESLSNEEIRGGKLPCPMIGLR